MKLRHVLIACGLIQFGFVFNSFGADVGVGDDAPCVHLNHLEKDNQIKEHCLTDREKDKSYALVEFFSISCGACMKNLPMLAKLEALIKDTTTLRMVSIDRNESAAIAFVKEKRSEIPYSVGFDSGRNATKAYQLKVTPTMFIINAHGKIVFKHEGTLEEEDLQFIQHLVQ